MAEGLSTRFRVVPGRLDAFPECARSRREQFDDWGASTLLQVTFSGGPRTGEYVLTQLFENGSVMAGAFDAAVLKLGRPFHDLFAIPHDVATVVEREILVEVQPFTFDPTTIPPVFRSVELRATPESASLLQATIQRSKELHVATGADAGLGVATEVLGTHDCRDSVTCRASGPGLPPTSKRYGKPRAGRATDRSSARSSVERSSFAVPPSS